MGYIYYVKRPAQCIALLCEKQHWSISCSNLSGGYHSVTCGMSTIYKSALALPNADLYYNTRHW